MAPTLPKEVVSSIECAVECALKSGRKPDRKSIAAIFNTSYVTVNNIEKRVEQRLLTGSNPQKPPGRPSSITPEIVQAVKELLERRPGLDQFAIADYLKEEFGVTMNQCTVSRLLKTHSIPHKRTNRLYRKMRILPSAEWDKERGQQKEGFRQSGSYMSPYATTTMPPDQIKFATSTVIPSSHTSYASPYS